MAHHESMVDLTNAEAPYSFSEITLDNGVHLNAKGHLAIARAIEQSWLGLFGSQ
jgi:lysophospholipase L1-like esterase